MVIKWHALHSMSCNHYFISRNFIVTLSGHGIQSISSSDFYGYIQILHLTRHHSYLVLFSYTLSICETILFIINSHLLIKPSISMWAILGLERYCKRTFKSSSRYHLLSRSLCIFFYLSQHLYQNSKEIYTSNNIIFVCIYQFKMCTHLME